MDSYRSRKNSSASLAVRGATLFAGTHDGVLRSVDSGSTWIGVKNGLPDSLGFKVWAADNTVFALSDSGTLFRSPDDGGSWMPTSVTHANITCFATNSADIYFGSSDGVFQSLDIGKSWTQANTGLTATPITTLAVYNGGDLFAGIIQSGIWRRSPAEMRTSGVVPLDHASIDEFGFRGGLGGELRSGARIEFYIQNRGLIDLSICDIRGNKIRTLLHSDSTPGIHQAIVNAVGLSTGIYYLRLQADGLSRLHRFVFER